MLTYLALMIGALCVNYVIQGPQRILDDES
jgi:hypothetical protein